MTMTDRFRPGTGPVRRFLGSTAAVVLVLALIAVVYLPGMVALFPLGHDVTAADSSGEDWLYYHENALSVLNDGLAMPSVKGPYYRPAGFGYSYFIAFVYRVAGVRSEAVYLAQAVLLLASVVTLFAAVRRRLSPTGGLALLVLLAAFMYVDVYRSATFRLLAENLLFPLTAALILLMLRGAQTQRIVYFVAAGAVCGLCFLVRPNVLLYGPALAVVTAVYLPQQSRTGRLKAAAVLIAACSVVGSLMAVRNFAVAGRPTTTVFNSNDWATPGFTVQHRLTAVERVERFIDGYGRRLAFMAGVPQLMQPTFRLRPHWLAMWAGVLVYLASLRWRPPEFWERVVLALSVCYFAPIIAVGTLYSYGIRMLTPGVPLAVLLAVKGVDLMLQRGDAR